MIDLHVHTTSSDGSDTPSRVIDLAIEKGLSAIAITDHDTVGGLDEALEYASDKDIKVYPGIEISTGYNGKDIHIVGFNIDYKCSVFEEFLDDFVKSRNNRNRRMCELLTEHGCPVDYDELLKHYEGSVITRAHMARFLFEKGMVSSVKEAFERYVGDRCPCFIPREKITVEDGIKLIVEAKGVPILAHPMLYHMSFDSLQGLVDRAKAAGLMGMEVVYTTNTQAEERKSREFAIKNGLVISGGSDYHGIAKPRTKLGEGFGNLYVDDSILDGLLNAQKERYGI